MMRTASVYRLSFLLAACFLGANFPRQAAADSSCHLAKLGDCCTVTLSPKTQVHLFSDIISGETVDYVVFRTKDSYTCTLQFDGDIKLPMRVRPGRFTGTWIGGETKVKYEFDELKRGSCQLDIFRMSIKGGDNKVLEAVCENGRKSP